MTGGKDISKIKQSAGGGQELGSSGRKAVFSQKK